MRISSDKSDPLRRNPSGNILPTTIKKKFLNDLLETVIKDTYITAVSALPPASGIAFAADDDDVLPFDDR